jgi:hypothetical protein
VERTRVQPTLPIGALDFIVVVVVVVVVIVVVVIAFSVCVHHGCVSTVNIQTHVFACTYVARSSNVLTEFIFA